MIKEKAKIRQGRGGEKEDSRKLQNLRDVILDAVVGRVMISSQIFGEL